MQNQYYLLEWDSNFYGMNVARLVDNSLNHRGVHLLKVLYNNDVDLAYYSSHQELTQDLMDNSLYQIISVVKRIPLIKTASGVYDIHQNISTYEKDYPEPELIKLAQLAGRQGRFSKDPNISKEKCDELFLHWIVNSVNKKMADEIIVYRLDEKIVGFATIKIEKGVGYTPLLAVNPKYEGKGISFALMRAIETRLVGYKCEKVIGGTQDLNLKALKVYERYGLLPQPAEFVYHLWKRNEK
jgi:dTDP-4-amino-4,6-dideoxy-D-galactose acyltransferase